MKFAMLQRLMRLGRKAKKALDRKLRLSHIAAPLLKPAGNAASQALFSLMSKGASKKMKKVLDMVIERPIYRIALVTQRQNG